MKFNWGTGILIVIILFLLACAAFIIFAVSQDVNLVHKDYYEKGVDYTDQININSRSVQFQNKIQVDQQKELIMIFFDENLATKVDSGSVLLYRPSDSKKDVVFPISLTGNLLKIPKENLISGRYILKLSWHSEGLKYEIDKTVNIE